MWTVPIGTPVEILEKVRHPLTFALPYLVINLLLGMHEEVQKKIDKLLEPPPVKALKPLPKPDDPIRKKRGGRR